MSNKILKKRIWTETKYSRPNIYQMASNRKTVGTTQIHVWLMDIKTNKGKDVNFDIKIRKKDFETKKGLKQWCGQL